MFCDSWYFQSIVVLPFQVEKPKTLVLCTIAENKQLFLDIRTDKNARNTWILRKRFFSCPMLVPLQSSSIMLLRIFYPCLQIRASWRESKCGGDVEVLAKELQQLLGQVEQGQHLLVHHLQPHLDPPDILRLRGLASLRSAFVPHCSEGSPSRSLPLKTPSFVMINKVSDEGGDDDVTMMMKRRRRRRKMRENMILNLCQVFPKQQCPTHDWDSTASTANPLADSNWTWASYNL